MCVFSRLSCIALLFGAFLGSLEAQTPVITRRLELLVSGLGFIDDIVTLPGGDVAVTRLTTNQRIDRIDLANGMITTLDPGPVFSHAMELSSDGSALYYGDILTGFVYRLDMTTTPPTRTVAVSGLVAPVDILADGANRLWIADHDGPGFPNGPCTLYRVDLVNGVAVQTTPVLSNLPGAPDFDFDATGTLIVMTTLAGPVVYVIDVATATVVGNLAFPNLVTAADIARLPDGNFLVSTGLNQQLLLLDVAAQTLLPMATNFSANGILGEDLAVLPSGDVVLTLIGGEIWRLDYTSPLRQFADARPGLPFGLDVHAPMHALDNYALAFAASATTGIAIGPTLFPLDNDPLLAFSLTRPPELLSFDGILDATGFGRGIVLLPNIPSITGFTLYFGGLFYRPAATPPVTGATQALEVTIQ